MMARGLVVMGGLEHTAGRSALAACLFGAEAAGRARQGDLMPMGYPSPADPTRYASDLGSVRSALGDDAFGVAWAQGQAMTMEDAVRMVLVNDTPADDMGPRRRPANGLTPREQEVTALVARGLSNRQIAEQLVFGERTAEAHVGHCLAKLGLSSRSQLAAWAVTQELLENGKGAVRT